MTSTRAGQTDGTTTSAQDTAPEGPSASTIVFDAVTKRYPGGEPGARPAVDAFSAELRPGAITVLLGSSGCGKTTTMKMINRLIEPTCGRIHIGDDESPEQALERVGATPAERVIFVTYVSPDPERAARLARLSPGCASASYMSDRNMIRKTPGFARAHDR